MRMLLDSVGIKKSEKEVVRLLGTKKTIYPRHEALPIAAEKLGLEYLVGKNSSFKELNMFLSGGYKLMTCYFLVEEDNGHYAVIRKIDNQFIYLLDPLMGPKTKYPLRDFKTVWRGKVDTDKGWFFGIK